MVGTVVKANIGKLEEEVRGGSSRRTREELTGVLKGVSGRRSFLARFQNGSKKNLSSNQLTVVIVENTSEEKEPEVSEITVIKLVKGGYLVEVVNHDGEKFLWEVVDDFHQIPTLN